MFMRIAVHASRCARERRGAEASRWDLQDSTGKEKKTTINKTKKTENEKTAGQ